MPTYITLVKYTQQGIENIRDSPDRLDDARALAESMGGAFDWYLTLGEYDAIPISEFPDDETYAEFVLAATSKGSVSPASLEAFDEAEYREVVAGIPG